MSGAGATGAKVRASHLLIKHRESRNPVSRRTGQEVSLTKEQARQELQAILDKLKSGADFATEASKRSDCSSFKKGGDLGFFSRGEMQKPFEDATCGLKVNEMSGIVETDSGLHLILRTG